MARKTQGTKEASGTTGTGKFTAGWVCPGCGRRFRRPTAEHTCQLYSLEQHCRGKPPQVVELCSAYLAAAAALGDDVSIEPLKTAIMLRTTTNFGSVRLTRLGLDCWLTLASLPDDPRISKSLRYTAGKLACAFRLHSLTELDEAVTRWLAEAYELASD
jgi:hypothetical protein